MYDEEEQELDRLELTAKHARAPDEQLRSREFTHFIMHHLSL